MLLRPPHSSELQPPLSPTNPLMVLPDCLPAPSGHESRQDDSESDERWLSQVEIVTHAGPHRRLWMGPQFTFKTYNSAVSGWVMELNCVWCLFVLRRGYAVDVLSLALLPSWWYIVVRSRDIVVTRLCARCWCRDEGVSWSEGKHCVHTMKHCLFI